MQYCHHHKTLVFAESKNMDVGLRLVLTFEELSDDPA